MVKPAASTNDVFQELREAIAVLVKQAKAENSSLAEHIDTLLARAEQQKSLHEVNEVAMLSHVLSQNLPDRFVYQVTRHPEQTSYFPYLVTDVTARHHALEALFASNTWFRNLVEVLPASVTVIQNERYVYCNSYGATIRGYETPNDLLGQWIFDYVQEGYHAVIRERARRLSEVAFNPPIEVEIRRKDGSGITVESISLTIEYDGAPAIMTFARDITDFKRMQAETLALELEREKTSVIAKLLDNASHDFRTPLSTIITSAHLLNRTSLGEQQQSRVQKIQNNATQLQAMFNDMFQLLELEFGSKFYTTKFDLQPVMEHLQIDYTERLRQNNQTLMISCDPPSLRILADIVELRRALRRLLDNACQYTPPNGEITLRAYANADVVYIDVVDTGQGIADADFPHIFKQFYRGDKARGLHSGGNGLGLTLALKVAELHGGTIRVFNQKSGGAVFQMVLPNARIDV